MGQRKRLCQRDARETGLVWEMRKAGLSLITGCKGAAKPATGIEDTAVRPEDLPEYYRRLSGLLRGHGLEASYYGHAASGLLHVRPVLDLHSVADCRSSARSPRRFPRWSRELQGLAGGRARSRHLPGPN